SATMFASWVLGTVRDQAPMSVRTAVDSETGALLASNPFSADFGHQVAFADVNLRPRTFCGDRNEFLGRNGSAAAPAPLGRLERSGNTGPALDPCAALQAKFELAPGETKEVWFLLGAVPEVADLRPLLERYRQPETVRAAFENVTSQWEKFLTAVEVHTPD